MNFSLETILGRLTNLNWLVPVFVLAALEDAVASRNVFGFGQMIGRRSP